MAEATQADITERLSAIVEPSKKISRDREISEAPEQGIVIPRQKVRTRSAPSLTPTETAQAQMLKERCQQLDLALFLDTQTHLRSLGITSAIAGEGKSFLAIIMAQVLAEDGIGPVTLIETNWQHPSLHEYFDLPSTLGLAEWLRGECDKSAIRYEVKSNMSVIPAGNSKGNAVKLLHQLEQRGLDSLITLPDERCILDLPAVLTTAYGGIAARLPEALLLVARAGTTPAPMLEEALGHLADLPVKSVILNHVESKIPNWIRRLL